jgi:hypothetical protein
MIFEMLLSDGHENQRIRSTRAGLRRREAVALPADFNAAEFAKDGALHDAFEAIAQAVAQLNSELFLKRVWTALSRSFQGLTRYHRVVPTTKPGASGAIPWDDPEVTVGQRWGNGGVTVGSRWGHGGVTELIRDYPRSEAALVALGPSWPWWICHLITH